MSEKSITSGCYRKHAVLMLAMFTVCFGAAWGVSTWTASTLADKVKATADTLAEKHAQELTAGKESDRDHETRLRRVEETIPRIDQSLSDIKGLMLRHLDRTDPPSRTALTPTPTKPPT